MPPIPHSNSDERVHHHPSCSSDKTRLNTMRMEFGTSFKRHASNNTSIARGPAPEYSSHHRLDSDTKKSRENVEDDDCCVPTFVPHEVTAFSNRDFPATRPEKLSIFHVEGSKKSSSIPLSTLRDKCLEGIDVNRNSRNHDKGHSERRCKETSVNTELQDARRKFTEPSNWGKTYLDEDNMGIIDVDKHSCHANQELHQESSGSGYLGGSRCLNHEDVVEEEGDSKYITGSCSKGRIGNNADKFDQETREKSNDPPQLGDEESEASMVGSLACMTISPDDVVGVIGTKHFWKARRAIVNQQRIFAEQVFELHRLIKVQKLIATSPDALKIDLYRRPSSPIVISENPPHECIEKSSSPPDNVLEHYNISEKLNQHTECQEEIPERDPPQCSNDSAAEIRPNSFFFQPPTNQWLVPVMSPSEGLIYKPYSGPCPPIGGFMSPFYGGYPPFGFQPPTYLQSPYGLPTVNPMFMSSATEQTNPFSGLQNSEHELQQSRNSYVVLNPRKEPISGRVRKFQASKDCEVQGSTTTNPCKQAQGGGKDERTLFHTPQASGTRNQMPDSSRQNHAIRVVPHNARSATESAARIFRSIQKERQQYKS